MTGARRFQLVNGLRSFLAGLGCAVLVIEDAHWWGVRSGLGTSLTVDGVCLKRRTSRLHGASCWTALPEPGRATL